MTIDFPCPVCRDKIEVYDKYGNLQKKAKKKKLRFDERWNTEGIENFYCLIKEDVIDIWNMAQENK